MGFKFYGLFFILLLAKLGKSGEIENVEDLENMPIFKTREIIEALQELDDTTDCNRDLKEFLRGLSKAEFWALSMLDSSAKIPEGLLMGNSYFMGQFDECVAVEPESKNFMGQHCLVNINIKIPVSVKKVRTLEAAQDITFALFYGICLPSTCTPKEINSALQNLLDEITNATIKLDVIVDEENCKTKETKPLTGSDWAVVGILIAFGVVALLSTLYDLFKQFYQKTEKPHPILSSFSIYSNGKQLFQISEGSSQLGCLHGLRFFSMCWVVLGHSYECGQYGPAVNLIDVATMMQDVNHTFIVNGLVSVDSFFFLSGLLVCFVFFRDIGKKKYYDVPIAYIHRYIRLTPPYGMMILIQATIFVYFGTGPLWHSFADPAVDVCRENWWSGLLYVQNFVAPHASCLGQSWYLAIDMQLFWLSPLLLYPMLFWPFFAPFYLSIFIVVAVCANFAIAYVSELGPTVLITTNPDNWTRDYINFYTRAVPWLIGAGLGYIICGIQAKKIEIKLTPLLVTIGWCLSTGLCLGSLYGVVPFTDLEYTTLEAAFYLSLHRVMWALGLAWVIFACIQGYGGVINTFLSWGVFQPLGKLSYCTYLIHISLQFYRLGLERTNFYAGDVELVYYYLGDLVISYLLAIPFTLLFEIPFGNIDRYLLQNMKILPLPRPAKENVKPEINNERLEGVVAGNESEDTK